MKNNISQYHWHYVRYNFPPCRSVLLTPVPRDMRMSRRMRHQMTRLRNHFLDIERQYHISDDVSEDRYIKEFEMLPRNFEMLPHNKAEVLAYQCGYYK